MSTILTGAASDPTTSPTATGPTDGDSGNAASVDGAFQSLLNYVSWLRTHMAQVDGSNTFTQAQTFNATVALLASQILSATGDQSILKSGTGKLQVGTSGSTDLELVRAGVAFLGLVATGVGAVDLKNHDLTNVFRAAFASRTTEGTESEGSMWYRGDTHKLRIGLNTGIDNIATEGTLQSVAPTQSALALGTGYSANVDDRYATIYISKDACSISRLHGAALVSAGATSSLGTLPSGFYPGAGNPVNVPCISVDSGMANPTLHNLSVGVSGSVSIFPTPASGRRVVVNGTSWRW